MNWRIFGFLLLLNAIQCLGQGQSKIVNNNPGGGDVNGNTDARLGLLATQLGLPPVAGYSEADVVSQAQIAVPPSDSGGGAPLPSPGYNVPGKNEHLVSPSQCQCVPVKQCPSYGHRDTGTIPVVGGEGGGDGLYVGGTGGSQGGNGGTNSYSSGNGGQHGGNIPVIGGNTGGHSNGYDQSPDGEKQPNTDGSGLLDLRIVNRPPGAGGVQCLNGQVFCCDFGPSNPNPGGNVDPPPYHGHEQSGGYATCGARKFIEVPGTPLQYGDAKFGAYPWMAVILGKGNNYVGAGALISPYYIITAAHKIKNWRPGTSMKVRFGEWNAKEDDEPYKNVEIDVAEVIIHPHFNPQNLQNDIALVRLATNIDLQGHPHIKAACLPQNHHYIGQRCWVAGFGKDAFGGGRHSYVMKEVDLPILDSHDCERRFRSTRLGKHFRLDRYSFICAGGEEGKDACTGDGGSPLVCNTGKGGGWEVVGLVAWGIGCADYGIPGAYVNVPNYLDWINQYIYKY